MCPLHSVSLWGALLTLPITFGLRMVTSVLDVQPSDLR